MPSIAPAADHHRFRIAAGPLTLSLAVALAVGAIWAAATPASAQQQQPHQLCKPGHNYDQSKGLCYDPAAAYKADIPKDEEGNGGGFFSGIGSSLGLGSAVSLCQYGDKHVGWGDDAYCVSRRTGQIYPATR